MNDKTIDKNAQLEQLMQDWVTSVKYRDEVVRAERRAAEALRQANHLLCKACVPKNAVKGESFCVWVGDSLLEVTVDSASTRTIDGKYLLKVRERGESLRSLPR